ncbi:AcrR family transcriptional regulator [Prauserella isguenensis]|uniref:AcrR family transcriptional regulator n=1 Tax=Prauserella isguenensis TaxID=1470180 RepID=A0A839S0Q5_9PSEU|nr:TetR/AcrR family transcriptional regulator [Prauserella isguenensis]MBB3051398.1 AcrR family transcriptional regulator [Prauserella isguenensis]
MRVHTGRRRNDEARAAILTAATDLLAAGEPVTLGAIAGRAQVGKQTIYRWWPSKGAVVLEAMTERARSLAPTTSTGYLEGDLEAFIAATFAAAGTPEYTATLRGIVSEALRDEHAAAVLAEFTADRREQLYLIIERWLPDVAADLAVDQVYGVLWYRLLIGHAEVDEATGRQLAATIAAQLRAAP